MSPIASFILDILKIGLPAAIVFATAYYMLKRQSETMLAQRRLDIKKSNQQQILPLKFQAYERLAVFCERSDLNNLMARFYDTDQTVGSLLFLMVGAIKQEYEHNVSQQVYVSDQLWQILKMARDQNIAVLQGLGEKVGFDQPSSDLQTALRDHLKEHPQSPLSTALSAIRTEASALT